MMCLRSALLCQCYCFVSVVVCLVVIATILPSIATILPSIATTVATILPSFAAVCYLCYLCYQSCRFYLPLPLALQCVFLFLLLPGAAPIPNRCRTSRCPTRSASLLLAIFVCIIHNSSCDVFAYVLVYITSSVSLILTCR